MASNTIEKNADEAFLDDETYFYTDDVDSFLYRKLKEKEYSKKYEKLKETELASLNAKFYRNITIQWNRELLPPLRPMFDERCLDYLVKDYKVTVSIVIAYKNDPLMLLLRTITTIVHRTSSRYLKEIILIDDNSDDDKSEEIQEYCRTQRIRLLYKRNDYHLGITRSRKKGILMANGDIIAILDSHIEVMELWLEPLLSMLTREPEAIVVPCIHMVNENKMSEDPLPPCFMTKPQFGYGLLQRLQPYNIEPTLEFKSPALLGGDIVAYRSTLLKLYPTPLITQYWDAENNRLSIRAWLCGKGIYMSMCSNIVHSSTNDVALGRYTRLDDRLFSKVLLEVVAEFVNYIPGAEDKQRFLLKTTGNKDRIQEVKNLSMTIDNDFFDPEKVGCKPYSYYLNNVIKNHLTFQSDQFAYAGEIQNADKLDICMAIRDFKIATDPCYSYEPVIESEHMFGFTKNNAMRVPSLEHNCLDSSNNDTEGSVPTFKFNCHAISPIIGKHSSSQIFIYNLSTMQIIHVSSNRCLDLLDDKDVRLYRCDTSKRTQMWYIRTPSWFSV